MLGGVRSVWVEVVLGGVRSVWVEVRCWEVCGGVGRCEECVGGGEVLGGVWVEVRCVRSGGVGGSV